MQNVCKPKSPESRMNFERFGESCSECKVSSSNTRTCNGESPELPYCMCFKKLWLHLPAHCPPFKQAIAPLVDCRCGKKKICLLMQCSGYLWFKVQNETTKTITKTISQPLLFGQTFYFSNGIRFSKEYSWIVCKVRTCFFYVLFSL